MSNKTPYIPMRMTPAAASHQLTGEGQEAAATAHVAQLEVKVGTALSSAPTHQLPTLQVSSQSMAPDGGSDSDSGQHSLIAEGVNFVGHAQLKGVCSVGGKVEGNLVQSAGHAITVIVTESGYVKGDIVASTISIMGQTDGLLDASGGSVTLHDASRVSGHVRYNRLQVNGADLNATLEKSPATRDKS